MLEIVCMEQNLETIIKSFLFNVVEREGFFLSLL